MDEEMILCVSNGYKRLYYFNAQFANIPDEVKDELQIMCVWFTEECGGILTLEFTEKGNLQFRLTTSEYDGYYDEIGADLKIRQMRNDRKELLRSLELYYKTVVLGMSLEELQESELEDDGDSVIYARSEMSLEDEV